MPPIHPPNLPTKCIGSSQGFCQTNQQDLQAETVRPARTRTTVEQEQETPERVHIDTPTTPTCQGAPAGQHSQPLPAIYQQGYPRRYVPDQEGVRIPLQAPLGRKPSPFLTSTVRFSEEYVLRVRSSLADLESWRRLSGPRRQFVFLSPLSANLRFRIKRIFPLSLWSWDGLTLNVPYAPLPWQEVTVRVVLGYTDDEIYQELGI